MADAPHPDVTVHAWAKRCIRVATQTVTLDRAVGRVLAQPIRADRDSPAHDVSAMDGYALRLADFDNAGRMPLAGEVTTGQAPPDLPPGHAVRIFTGGCVPKQAELVIKREDLAETLELIELQAPLESFKVGQHIRRRGENAKQGDAVVPPGVALTPAVVGAAAAFGTCQPSVYRRVRVGLLTTGDELLAPDDQPEPWQIRDSNGPVIASMLQSAPWLDLTHTQRGGDNPKQLTRQLDQLLEQCDAVITTGGVSMGDHDYIPAVVRALGGEVAFHKLPVRPGKPMLGAIGPAGQPILGLPGNPVSAMATLRRFGRAALRHIAGFEQCLPPAASVRCDPPTTNTTGLWWYQLATIDDAGCAQCVATRGSGDLASAARSDGLIELPPGTMNATRALFHPWPLD
ncbi:MAG: molybdopterin molybdotransferase MoeA [Phycisphaerales bacterium JB063]